MLKKRKAQLVITTAAAFGMISACADEKEIDDDVATPAAEVTPAVTSTFSDANLVQFLEALNASEVQEAELARSKTQNEEVRKFADVVLRDHQQLTAQAGALADAAAILKSERDAHHATPGTAHPVDSLIPAGTATTAVTPGTTSTSPLPGSDPIPTMRSSPQGMLIDQLKQESEQARARLQALSGAAFDRAYMDRQVQAHQWALDLLDQQLIPDAQNSRLRPLLESTRSSMQAHLSEARRIQQIAGASL